MQSFYLLALLLMGILLKCCLATPNATTRENVPREDLNEQPSRKLEWRGQAIKRFIHQEPIPSYGAHTRPVPEPAKYDYDQPPTRREGVTSFGRDITRESWGQPSMREEDDQPIWERMNYPPEPARREEGQPRW